MKKVILLFAVAASVLLTSCSGSDDAPSKTDDAPSKTDDVASKADDVASTANVLLKKTIQTQGDKTITTNFSYNDNKIATIISDNGLKQQFTYTGDLITKIEVFNDDKLQQTFTYEYNSDKQVITFNSIDKLNLSVKETYVYNADSTVSVAKYIGSGTSLSASPFMSIISFEKGEISMIQYQSPDLVTKFTYDTKNNPLRNVIGLDRIAYAGEASSALHNVVKMENVGAVTFSTQYTYNPDNYPVKSTQSSTFSDVEFKVVKEYFY